MFHSSSSTMESTTELTRLLECRICLEGLQNCHICFYCSQPFCRACIDNWFKKDRKCPGCRTLLASQNCLVKVGTFDQIQEQLSRMLSDETRNRCSQHPKDRLSLFCEPCEECICASCLLSEQHRDHKDLAVLLEDIYDQYEEKLQFVLGRIETRKIIIKGSLNDVEDNLKSLTKQLEDETKILDANMSSIEKVRNQAEALLKAKKDATTLKAIMKILQSAESTLSEEAQTSAEINERLLKFFLINPATLEFQLDRADDDVDLVSELLTVDGFRWAVKLSSENALYLSLHEGIPGFHHPVRTYCRRGRCCH
uniref:E3 ubiquitin-protein ligase TRIM37 n=1 Tax=Culex pipiens TaxID=7175 RepID=A0A8D8DS72_CULPI